MKTEHIDWLEACRDPVIEAVARKLAAHVDHVEPGDTLEPGNTPFPDETEVTDGIIRGASAFFRWRQFVAQAKEIMDLVREKDGDQVKQLQAWNDSAMALEREWDEQRIAKLLGARLGQSCRKVVNARVPELLDERVVLIDALREIANEDYRGNRPHSAVVAYNALKKVGIWQ